MIVLDASALVDLVIGRSAASGVAAMLEREAICAPAHQPAEVLSAIGRLERAGEVSTDEAGQALEELHAFRQELVVPTLSALREAFALRERIRLLDGLYVSLALQRDATLVTTDARLARANPPCTTWSPV